MASYNQFATRVRVRDVVSPVDEMGRVKEPVISIVDGKKIVDYGDYTRPGGSIISREQGKRFIAVKFAVRDRDLTGAVADVQRETMKIVKPPYRAQFGGEFEQMQDAEARLMVIIPASLGLICILLYVAFRSIVDVLVILSNVLDVAVVGIWALYLTGTHFNVSSAVGFVSLFGVAIMEGMLMIGYFNDLRGKGLPVYEAITEGATKRVRPVMITAYRLMSLQLVERRRGDHQGREPLRLAAGAANVNDIKAVRSVQVFSWEVLRPFATAI
jgi:cobalt-zinc-cadmium resistance protein CzcA